MVSYFRLDGIRVMPRFLWNALRTGRQMSRSEGLVCYSSGARLNSLEFWSTTVWKDEQALMGFVRTLPHSEIMEEMRSRIQRSAFVRWKIGGSDVPPDRRKAEELLRCKLDGEDAIRSGDPEG